MAISRNSKRLIALALLAWFSQAAFTDVPRPRPRSFSLKTISVNPPSENGLCHGYSFVDYSTDQHAWPSELSEMSGLAASRRNQGVFYHINDSGNAAFLFATDLFGHILRRTPFAEESTDAEDLSIGPCPGRALHDCLYVADTGDNFHLRASRHIIALDEDSLDQEQAQRRRLEFAFDDGKSYDIEAMAVHPKNATIYLFSKGHHHSQVFVLPPTSWDHEHPIAYKIATLPYAWVTGASFNADGTSLLLLTPSMVLALDLKPYHPWLVQNVRKIEVPVLPQAEAIVADPHGPGFYYSSEQRRFEARWGVIKAQCQHRLIGRTGQREHS